MSIFEFSRFGLGEVAEEEYNSDEYEDVPSEEAEQSDIDSDFGGSFGENQSFSEEETKSRFTNYSMTSSVIKRNEGLTLLDNRFEKVGTLSLFVVIVPGLCVHWPFFY